LSLGKENAFSPGRQGLEITPPAEDENAVDRVVYHGKKRG